MTIDFLLLYSFSALALAGSLGMVFFKNLVRIAISLLVCLVSLSGIYSMEGAGFLGATQIMVYAGGILVLILFGVMLTFRYTEDNTHRDFLSGAMKFISLSGLSVFMVMVAVQASSALKPWQDFSTQVGKNELSPLKAIGISFLTTHAFPFQLAGVLLMLSLMGAALISSGK